MRKCRYILALLLLLFVPRIGAVQLTSSDPYWIGSKSSFTSTEGTDFWLTFMNNAGFDPTMSEYANTKFELNVIVAARQQTTVYVAIGNQEIELPIEANQVVTYNVSDRWNDIYLREIDETKVSGTKKGIHVYTKDGKSFSCFSYSRVGEKGSSSRDASLIIPTKFLGKEYFVQTYPEDDVATEFAIVATENATDVTIVPKCASFGGTHPANQSYTITLDKGDAYLFASTQHIGDDITVDVSGTSICATHPIAVFNGNVKTKIDYAERNSEDHLIEQALPITQLGKEFYLSLLDSTKTNRFRVTATQANTLVKYYYPDPSWYYEETLNAGESSDPVELSSEEGGALEVRIETDKPVIMFGYMTSGAENVFTQRINNKTNKFGFGDPANAMLPSWAHRTKSMNLFVKELDPFKVPTNTVNTPQHFYAYVVIPSADKDKLTLNGGAVDASLFKDFEVDGTMAHGCISLPGEGYHLVESSGDGFVGYVYGMSEAQGYFYTLGYTPDPFRDSLFVTNTGNIMSKKSYDLPRIDNGWYQRQWDEWMEGHERLDTAVVCDGETVNWLVQTPIAKHAEPVDWYIYDVTNTPESIHKNYPTPTAKKEDAARDGETSTDWLYNWQYTFKLPDESHLPPEQRTPYMDFEIQAVLHKKHLLCVLDDDLDTIRTVVRVARTYDDTVHHIICMGDSMEYFYDSLYRQGNLSLIGDHAQTTMFVGDKTAGDHTEPWHWKARAGQNFFHREYETRFGCDSLVTLDLFVCDTFRIIDTIYLCDNECAAPYEGKTYCGQYYEGPGTVVTKDTIAEFKYKTTYCACQLDPNYPPFQGCDSIYELHIFISKTSRDTTEAIMCFNDKPDSAYVWTIQEGTKDSLITKDHPNMQWNESLQAWIGYFSDTLRTADGRCNNGNGCDSIEVLRLIIPQSYYFEEIDTTCKWSYNYETRQKETLVYRWMHHRNGADYVDLPSSGDYYDSCQTRFGCDSIYHLNLTYVDPFLGINSHSMANNQKYTWHGVTYGPFDGTNPNYPNLKNIEDTTLYFYDANATVTKNGCDSIWRLDLRISDTYLFKSYRTICDYDSLHWRTEWPGGKIVVGSKWEGTDPQAIRLFSLDTIVYDSLLTVELPQRDSVYQLNIHMNPSYKQYDTLHVCNNRSVQWEGKTYAGEAFAGAADVKYAPSDAWYNDTHALTTAGGNCDSILYLALKVHPIYADTTRDTICQGNGVYAWDDHANRMLFDKTHGQPISSEAISAVESGTFLYIDSLRTLTCVECQPAGCDSVWVLELVVKPIVYGTTHPIICPTDLPYHYGPDPWDVALETGTYKDTLTSVQYECDSIVTIELEVRDEIRTVLPIAICDNQLPYNHPYPNTPDLQNLYATGIYTQILTSVTGCDSIVEVQLTVNNHDEEAEDIYICLDDLPHEDRDTHLKVYSDSIYTKTLVNRFGCDSIVTTHVIVGDTFRVTDAAVVLCENEKEYIWHTRDSYGEYEWPIQWGDLHQQVWDTTLVDTLHTVFREQCDSITSIHITVNPTTFKEETVAWCKSSGPYAYGEKGKTAFESGDYRDTLLTQNQYGCDSILILHFTAFDSIYYDEAREMCDNDTVVWQKRLYVGSKFAGMYNSPDFTEVIPVSGALYRDTATYYTALNHCDSLYYLTLTIHPTYLTVAANDTTRVSICDDETYRFLTANEDITYNANGEWVDVDHKIQRYLLTGMDTTVYGCDSAVAHVVTVYPTYDYSENLQACQKADFAWAGHETHMVWDVQRQEHIIGSSIPTDVLIGDYIYIDSLLTQNGHACDSVWALYLHIDSTYYHADNITMSDEESRKWQHAVYIGSKVNADTLNTTAWFTPEETEQKIVRVPDGQIVNEYDVTYPTVAGCDSTFHLRLLVGPTFRDTIVRYTCDNEPYHWFHAGDPDHEARTDLELLEPKLYYDSLHTVGFGFDSIYVLDLRNNPTFTNEKRDTVCQVNGGHYAWLTHEGHTLWDIANHTYVTEIPISEKGEYTFIDSLKTQLYQTGDGQVLEAGCDSIWTLHLVVAPTYHFDEAREMCDNDTVVWQKRLYVGSKFAGTYNSPDFTEVKTVYAGITNDIASYQTAVLYACDSVYELTLTVHASYLTVAALDTTRVSICDDEEYRFLTANEDITYNANGEWVDADQKIQRYVLTGMDTTVYGCDSAVAHVVTVYPTYDYSENLQTCQGEATDYYRWQGHENHFIWDAQQNKRISAVMIPTNVRVGDYVYIDSLHAKGSNYTSTTLVLPEGCDSIWTLHLHIDSTYYHEDAITMSDEESRKWQHAVYIGSKVNADTLNTAEWFTPEETEQKIVRVPDGQIVNEYDVTYSTVAGCDSTFHLRLLVGPTFRDTIVRYTCDNEPYHWFHAGDPDHEARTDLELLEPKLYYDSLHTVGFGFDSIYVLDLRNNPTFRDEFTDTICQEAGATYIWEKHEGHMLWDVVNQRRISVISIEQAGEYTFIDSLKTQTYLAGDGQVLTEGCDSIWTLHLLVPPIHHFYETRSICASDSLQWQGLLFTGDEFAAYHPDGYDASAFRRAVTALPAGEHMDTAWYHTVTFGCDSIYHLTLNVLPVHRTSIERRTCQSEGTYFYEHLNNGEGGYLQALHLSDSLVRNDTLPNAYGCDSIITLHFYVDSVYSFGQDAGYVCQEPGEKWYWYNEFGGLEDSVALDEGDKYYTLGKHYQTIHGCDSTFGITLYVAPVHHFYETLYLCESDSLHWQGMVYTGSQFADYYGAYDASSYRRTTDALVAGEYSDTAWYHTAHYGCDSIYHLTLYVHEVAHTDTLDSVCQGYPFFNPNWNRGEGKYMNTERVGTYISVDTIASVVTGCDSIVTFTLRVDSVYDYRQHFVFCQDTIDTQRDWIDDEGHLHTFRMDVSVPGDFSFDEPHTTIHGCDSVYGITWHVNPIYRFDSAYAICENERLEWQRRSYAGDSVKQPLAADKILTVGLHYDTAHYTTADGCDSTYYMQVMVYAVYDTTTYTTVCYTDDYHWLQNDPFGTYDDQVWYKDAQDTIFISPLDAQKPQPARDTLMRYAQRMLHSIHGCDSMSRLTLTVMPTYFFYSDTSICSNEKLYYRGKYFSSHDTTYTDSLKTKAGCDSIYQLHLHVKPAYLIHNSREICDNETLYHEDGVEIVWRPGNAIPQPGDFKELKYFTEEGCDSIYYYYITVHPTFYSEAHVNLCSKEMYLLQGDHYVGDDTIYDVNTFVLPHDTIFTDSLSSVHGCDSVYRVYAHIMPQYYHLDQDTICDDGAVTWRSHEFSGLAAGEYITFDSLLTGDGCDSVYEFRLLVTPTYLFEETVTKCADDDLWWRNQNLSHVLPGDTLVTDSLLTELFGCDSVYHLYLTVLDTTYEIIFDTICESESYILHGVPYTETGDYKDTTLNSWGCHHFTYLHLHVIPPTVPTAWADSICADDQAYELYYSYTGRDPIAYSVYYDEMGHFYGFVDIENQPIESPEELHMLTLPMPLRNEDNTKYPRPDHYPITLILDNGICTNPDLCRTDTNVVLSYPSWITEQRFHDVIAILNEKYNGGYLWDHFQWYKGDTLLVGETHEYLYIPKGLGIGNHYHVRLTRENETEDFQTCPITIVSDPVPDDFSPTMGYLSVTPTFVVTGHPVVSILSRKDGYYRVTTREGLLVTEGVFRADVTEVELPAIVGLYIFQLWSSETPEEPYRNIKVIVGQ